MISPHDRANRYRERAEECLRTAATSQTPGADQIYLLIAEHCLVLAASEMDLANRAAAIADKMLRFTERRKRCRAR
jgi:hypothetical protein